MKLDYLDDLTDGGKYRQVVSERLVRIWDFTDQEVKALVAAIKSTVLQKGGELHLHELSLIEAINCKVILSLADDDYGIIEDHSLGLFVCKLTKSGYENMVEGIELTNNGHNWLYEDSVDGIDFLFSHGGEW